MTKIITKTVISKIATVGITVPPHLIIQPNLLTTRSCLFCYAKQAALSREGRELGITVTPHLITRLLNLC